MSSRNERLSELVNEIVLSVQINQSENDTVPLEERMSGLILNDPEKNEKFLEILLGYVKREVHIAELDEYVFRTYAGIGINRKSRRSIYEELGVPIMEYNSIIKSAIKTLGLVFDQTLNDFTMDNAPPEYNIPKSITDRNKQISKIKELQSNNGELWAKYLRVIGEKEKLSKDYQQSLSQIDKLRSQQRRDVQIPPTTGWRTYLPVLYLAAAIVIPSMIIGTRSYTTHEFKDVNGDDVQDQIKYMVFETPIGTYRLKTKEWMGKSFEGGGTSWIKDK